MLPPPIADRGTRVDQDPLPPIAWLIINIWCPPPRRGSLAWVTGRSRLPKRYPRLETDDFQFFYRVTYTSLKALNELTLDL